MTLVLKIMRTCFATLSDVDLALENAFEQERKISERILHDLQRKLLEALVERDKVVY